MSNNEKVKDIKSKVSKSEVVVPDAPSTPLMPPTPPTANVATAPVVAPAIHERISETDKMALDLAKSKRQTALAEAKTALAQNENAELSFKYVVLQLYMKYGLTERDALSEAGEIIRNGAIQQAQVK